MSDSENTFNDDISSTMTINSDDSSIESFKPAIKIGKEITLEGLDDDMSEYISDTDSEDEDEQEGEMALAGNTDDEDEDDDDKRPTLGDIDDDDDNINYERDTTPNDSPEENIKVDSPIQELEKAEDEDSDDDESDEDYDEDYLKKFDREVINNYIVDHHPEAVAHNFDEVKTMSNVVRNSEGIIVDKLHRTIPILTKFEKARVLGIRAKQLNDGAKPFIKHPTDVIDGYTIARMELTEKLMPFIIRRPIPNGGCEYWKIADLELI
jgi:DNA-directed RNA polymerases I, II, and III subunit RPABC2